MIINLSKDNKLFKFIIIIFSIFLILLFVPSFYNYQGNKIIYLIFTIVFNLLIFNFLFTKTNFYEVFFGILIWMGFWLKFSIFESHIYRFHSIFDGRALCNFDTNNFDQILIISTVGCLGFLLSSFISKFFNYNLFNFSKKNSNKFKKNFFSLIFFFTVIFYLTIIIINFNFDFYRKGLLPNNTFLYLESIFLPYLYNIGFGAAVCFIIYNLHVLNNKNLYIVLILICIEGFVTNTSMLSRNMILYSSSIFLGYIVLLSNDSKGINIKKFIYISSLLLIITFVLSILVTNKLRSNEYLVDSNNPPKTQNYECKINEQKKLNSGPRILDLLLTRSIGIEGIITTYNNKDILGFNLIRQSFNETGLENQSFYEKNFLADQKRFKSYKGSNQVILPGIFGYLFFSGSYVFLFLGIFFISLILMTFENLTIILTKNIVLVSFISFVVVWRLINFGYLVSNTLNFIIAIVATTIIIFFLQKLIK